MSISDIRKVNSGCSCQFYSNKLTESEKINHHMDNLSEGFALHPFVIDSTGNWGPMATKFIKFINEISGVKENSDGKGRRTKMSGKEVFMRRRILFLWNLRGAIARENALLQLKPYRATGEFHEFNSL